MVPGQRGSPLACRLLTGGKGPGREHPGCAGAGAAPTHSAPSSPLCRSSGPGPPAPVRWESRWGGGHFPNLSYQGLTGPRARPDSPQLLPLILSKR